ncbi:hypothetical protein T484DRAFT_1804722, partial [Baffinella frigidus]
MCQSTPTKSLKPNAKLPPRRLSSVCNLSVDVKDTLNLWSTASSPSSTQPSSKSSWPSRAGKPSPSTFASFPFAASSPNKFSAKTPAKLLSLVQRRRSMVDATQNIYPFEDLTKEDSITTKLSLASTPTVQCNTNTTSEIRQARSNSVSVAPIAAPAAPPKCAPPVNDYAIVPDAKFKAHRHLLTAPPSPPASKCASPVSDYAVVTDANFKAHRHRRGECLAHPLGCDCETVQLPTLHQNDAWQVMSLRYKSVYDPLAVHKRPALLAPLSTGANAPRELEHKALPRAAPRAETVLERKERERTERVEALHIKERREREVLVDKVLEPALPPHRARSSGYGWWRQTVSSPKVASSPKAEAAPGPSVVAAAMERRERANALRRTKSIAAVFPRHASRGSTPAVLAVPTRVATRLRLQAMAHA